MTFSSLGLKSCLTLVELLNTEKQLPGYVLLKCVNGSLIRDPAGANSSLVPIHEFDTWYLGDREGSWLSNW